MNSIKIGIEIIKEFCVKNKGKIGIFYCILFALTFIIQKYLKYFLDLDLSWISDIREVTSFVILLIALIPRHSIFNQEKQYGGIFNIGNEYGRFLVDFIKNISNITNSNLQRTSINDKNKICKFYNIDKLYFSPNTANFIVKARSEKLQIELKDFEFYKPILIEDKIITELHIKPNNVEFVYELNASEIYKLVKKCSIIEHYLEDRLK